MSEELTDAVAAAEQSGLMAKAFSLCPQAHKAAEQVIHAADDGTLAAALDGFADLAAEMSCTVALVDDPNVSVHAEFMEQTSRVARAASRYFAARSSCDASLDPEFRGSMEPAFKQGSPHIHKALEVVRARAQEVMKASGQGTAVRLFTSIVHAGLTPSR